MSGDIVEINETGSENEMFMCVLSLVREDRSLRYVLSIKVSYNGVLLSNFYFQKV